MVNKKLFLPIIIALIVVFGVWFVSGIIITNINPTGDLVTNESTVNFSYGIHTPDGLRSITHSWNGKNTTLYDSSLVLFMNVDNRSALGENDTFIADLGLYGNNGTIVGAKINDTFCRFNKCLSFDSVNDYIANVTNNFQIGNNSNFTLSIWFYLNDTSERALFYFGNDTDYLGFYISSNTTSARKNNSGGGTLTYKGLGTIPVDYRLRSWVNWIFVYNNTLFTSYFNGVTVSDGSGTLLNLIPDYQVSNTRIGAFFDNTRSFKGYMDDIMIFNKTLSSDEVYNLYNSQLTKFNSSYWEYNQTMNNTLYSQDYFLCSSNLTGFETCSATQNVGTFKIISVNFSDSIGIIRSDFYGVSNYNTYVSNLSYIGEDLDIRSNASWLKEVFQNSGMNVYRSWVLFSKVSTGEGTFNTSDFTGGKLYNINALKDEVKWCYENDLTHIIVLTDTPDWLANKTSGWCNQTPEYSDLVDWSSCSPTNYTKWAEMAVQLIDYVTEDGKYNSSVVIEVGNEMHGKVWLSNLSDDNIIKATEYIKLYNATYDAIKNKYPNMPVGGNAGYSSKPNMKNTFLSNETTNMDFYSEHIYSYDTNGFITENKLLDVAESMTSGCTTYGANCSHMIISEWGDYRTSPTNLSDEESFKASIALGFVSILNYNPVNFSILLHGLEYTDNWTTPKPERKLFLSQTRGNVLYNYYNVTKNFAHLCTAGATVYVSSSDDPDIKVVSCQKGNQYAIIPINTGTEAKNVTLNMSMENGTVKFPYASLMNYETGASIPVSTSGIAQLGVIGEYEVLYLTSGDEDGGTLVNLFKLNEYTGSVVYDALFGTSNGTRSGATWVTDGVLRTLTSVTDYVFSGDGILTLTSSNIFSYLLLNWDLSSVSVLRENFSAGIDNVSGKIPLLFLVLIVGVILMVLGGLTALFYLLMKKVPSRFSGGV